MSTIDFTRRLLGFTLVALLVAECAWANEDPFPRLGGVNNGGSHRYDEDVYQAHLAKLNVAVVSIWPGWNRGKKMTFDQVVRNIKKINPNTRIFLYENSMEVSATDPAWALFYRKVDSAKWWLTSPGSDEKILSAFGVQAGKPIYQINTTRFTPRDRDGYQEWEWHARWIIDQFYKPNPSIDGFFEDNVFYQPRVAGDWNLDGSKDTPASAGKWLREGYRARFALLHKLMPGKYQLGNLADWGNKKADLTELKGALDGGIMEGILGTKYAPETWGSWAEMMRWYRKTMDAVAEPKLVLFNMHGAATDYQALRYGLASCLLDDGYFAFTDASKGYGGMAWFDEFDVKLGKAISPTAMKPWQKGVYRRDFEKGIALVNPKGNGAQDVTLEDGFRHFAGKQAPDVNDGKDVKSIHLLDRDGIILLRKSSAPHM
jgi:putative glycosyl hydrolase-like family 15 (GHL15) protein